MQFTDDHVLPDEQLCLHSVLPTADAN
jgi:hypothetical protein